MFAPLRLPLYSACDSVVGEGRRDGKIAEVASMPGWVDSHVGVIAHQVRMDASDAAAQ